MTMQGLDFDMFKIRGARMREIAGSFLELLHDPDKAITDWLQEVETEDATVAAAIRDMEATVVRDEEDQNYERRRHVQEVMDVINASPYPDVETGVPESGKTFENFTPRIAYPTVDEAQQAVRRWLVGTDEVPLLVLAGVPGSGKTHLAEAAANTLASTGHILLFRTEAGLVGEAMKRMQTHSVEQLMEAVTGTGWLILDDLGVAAVSDWGRGVMDRIINDRYILAQQRMGYTLITTNVAGKDLSSRMLRRFNEPGVSRVLEIKAPNYFDDAKKDR